MSRIARRPLLLAAASSFDELRRREWMRQAAVYLDKIFKGASASELPIEQPAKYDLVINKHTAAALHLSIPESLSL